MKAALSITLANLLFILFIIISPLLLLALFTFSVLFTVNEKGD